MPTAKPSPDTGQSLAVLAESLYLVNLLLVPGIPFVWLIWLYRKHSAAPPLARNHLCQTISTTIWAGIALVLVNIIILLTGGYTSPYVWMIVLIYFICGHSVFSLLGMWALTRAMAGREYRYPFKALLKCDE